MIAEERIVEEILNLDLKIKEVKHRQSLHTNEDIIADLENEINEAIIAKDTLDWALNGI